MSASRPSGDPGRAVRDLARQEVERPPRAIRGCRGSRTDACSPYRRRYERTMKKEYAFAAPYGVSGMIGRLLRLRCLERLAEDLARRRLVDASARDGRAHRLRAARSPRPRRTRPSAPAAPTTSARTTAPPGCRPRPARAVSKRAHERRLVEQVGLDQFDSVAHSCRDWDTPPRSRHERSRRPRSPARAAAPTAATRPGRRCP